MHNQVNHWKDVQGKNDNHINTKPQNASKRSQRDMAMKLAKSVSVGFTLVSGNA